MRKSKEEIRAGERRESSVGMKRLLIGYRTLMEESLEVEGVTVAQLRMLRALEEHPEIPAAELARTCYISPQSMQAVVTRAEREGWITRSAAPGNRRVLNATLTAQGKTVLERGSALAAEIEQDIWRDVKRSELQQLNATLAKGLLRLSERLQTRQKAAARYPQTQGFLKQGRTDTLRAHDAADRDRADTQHLPG